MDKVQQIKDYIEKLKHEGTNPYDRRAFELLCEIGSYINSLPEEPVSEDLEEASNNYAESEEKRVGCGTEFFTPELAKAFKAGSQWQKEQFEKNRLAACDKQTEEEAEIERDFVMGIIEEEHRQPTYSDAIEYGMKKTKEQMMKDSIDATKVFSGIGSNSKTGECVPYTEYKICISDKLCDGLDKVKLIIIKEEQV